MNKKIKIVKYNILERYNIFKCTICNNWNINCLDVLNSEQLKLVEDHVALCGEDNGSN